MEKDRVKNMWKRIVSRICGKGLCQEYVEKDRVKNMWKRIGSRICGKG